MRVLLRYSIFILFPAVIVAIVFLFKASIGTAVSFGEWGEQSIAASTLLVAKEKIDRAEQIIKTTDSLFFEIVDPAKLDESCELWQKALISTRQIEGAAIVNDDGEIISFFHRKDEPVKSEKLHSLIENDIAPRFDKWKSFNRFKHLHARVGEDFRLITYLTTTYRGQDYTSCIVFDTNELLVGVLGSLLDNLGKNLMYNVVDDHNQPVLGYPIEGAGGFIVSRPFPSTLYKWRLQLAPTSAALFESKAQAKWFSQVMLIPLALSVIVFGLVVLYLSFVRERRINRLQSEFVANVSHELKTPLSLIRMFSELLLLGKVDDKAKTKRYHEIILRETERLTALIDNVLNLSKIESGKTSYQFEVMDVAQVVSRGVETYRARVEKAGLKLDFSVTGQLPPARIDDDAIILVVINLIDNAVKYAKGTEMVGVDLYSKNDTIFLDVYDNGIGIEQSMRKRVFERFFRIPTENTKKERGSGIGLSLVKHIAGAHGGSVRVTSIPGKETRFSVRIPAHEQ